MSETKKTGEWIVQLEPGCWLAPWDGDPGRTVLVVNAKRFDSRLEASIALSLALKYSQFKNAEIHQIIEG